MIPYYAVILSTLFALATLSLVLGVIAKAAGFAAFGVLPLTYLRFTGICLLFTIALGVAQLSLRTSR